MPHSKQVAAGHSDSTVTVWNVASGSLLLTVGQSSDQTQVNPNAVAWSPDGKQIVYGTNTGLVQVLDAVTGKLGVVYKGFAEGISAVKWLSDSKRIAAASFDGTVQLFDAGTGSQISTYTDPSGDVETMDLSPDGMYVVTGGVDMKERVSKLG